MAEGFRLAEQVPAGGADGEGAVVVMHAVATVIEAAAPGATAEWLCIQQCSCQFRIRNTADPKL